MKNENRYLLVSVTLLVALAFVLFGCVFANAAAKSGQERCDETKDKNVCDAGSIFDMITPEIVAFYENEIAGEKVLSNKTDAQLAGIAKRYNISVAKAKGVIVTYDFANRTGGGIDFPSIAKMSDMKMLAFVKGRAEIYMSDFTNEQKEELKKKGDGCVGIQNLKCIGDGRKCVRFYFFGACGKRLVRFSVQTI